MIRLSRQTSDNVLDSPDIVPRRLMASWLLHHIHLDLFLMMVLGRLLRCAEHVIGSGSHRRLREKAEGPGLVPG